MFFAFTTCNFCAPLFACRVSFPFFLISAAASSFVNRPSFRQVSIIVAKLGGRFTVSSIGILQFLQILGCGLICSTLFFFINPLHNISNAALEFAIALYGEIIIFLSADLQFLSNDIFSTISIPSKLSKFIIFSFLFHYFLSCLSIHESDFFL